MRFQLVSDLHADIFSRNKSKARGKLLDRIEPVADVLVLAGDAGELDDRVTRDCIRALCRRYKHVIYVLGNHEYYQCTVQETHDLARGLVAECANLHWLDDSTVTVEGQRFVGGTLWYPQRPDPHGMAQDWSDFRAIRKVGPWIYNKNRTSQAFLYDTVTADDVVVTHMLPHVRTIALKYLGDAWNRFFLCDMSDLITERQPKAWVFGHTHTPCDVREGVTRLVCNPFGYPREDVAFHPGLVIDV